MDLEAIESSGLGRDDLVAIAVAPGVGAALTVASTGASVTLADGEWAEAVARIEATIGPRWVMWSTATAVVLARAGVRLARAWDLAAVHRLLVGGWAAEPARVWAWLHDLPTSSIPEVRPPDLFNQGDADRSPLDPVRPDGHLRPDWVDGGWADLARLGAWSGLAAAAALAQRDRLEADTDRPRARITARSESTTELLCAELAVDGLPMDLGTAERIVAGFIGPRPRSDADAAVQRERRDHEVLRHVPGAEGVDLRSPGQVRSLLHDLGIDVPDTRAWRLERVRDAHPVIDALLAWRKAERISTTYGYDWLDANVAPDGRLRGEWSGADGAAGRMTASGGLHNLPADLRDAVVAEPGHVLVRADLGQIEPRVLAAVSGDVALAAATRADDLYAPVADELGVDRATAKVAVLGAMYGQTTGHGATALRGLHAAYPVAMAYLDEADRRAQVGHDLCTYGGRLVRMGGGRVDDRALTDREARSRAAARGRYGRNALVQGAAAELFKLWAVTVRARSRPEGGRIVLCLHDELLVHAPADRGDRIADLLDGCLQEAARRWAPDHSVRFLADVRVVHRWSDAKD